VRAGLDKPTGSSSSIDPAFIPMAREKKDRPKLDLEAEALTALEAARRMQPGAERTEAMKRAGILKNAADLQELFFAKQGGRAKNCAVRRAR
jgi:hypothetical protein